MRAVPIALLVLCGWLAVFTSSRGRILNGENDFLQMYGGARLVGTGELYSAEAMLNIHEEVTGKVYPSILYVRPPFLAWVLKPLGALPYRTAYLIFQILSFTALAGFLALYLRSCPELLVFTCASGAVVANFANGQDVAFCLFFAGLSLAAARRGLDFAAGVILALCAIKYHLFALVPLVVIAQRRWNILAGGAAGGAVLFLISCAADGWDWPARCLARLLDGRVHPSQDAMPNVHGALTSLGIGSPVLEGLLVAGVIGLVVVAAVRIRDYDTAFALGIIGSLLTGFHAYLQDCMLLLLPFAVLTSRVRLPAVRGLTALAVLAPALVLLYAPWSWVAPVLLALPLTASALRLSSEVLPEAAGQNRIAASEEAA